MSNRRRRQIKPEIISIEAFVDLDQAAKASACAALASAAPRFALALSSTMGPGASDIFTQNTHSGRSMIGEAIFSGQSGLARIWARQLTTAPAKLPQRRRQVWNEWLEALASPATEPQLLRIFAWLSPALAAAAGEAKDDPAMLASRAIEAFAQGRPWTGLRIAERLLTCAPSELAEATAPSFGTIGSAAPSAEFAQTRSSWIAPDGSALAGEWTSDFLSCETRAIMDDSFVRLPEIPCTLLSCSLLSLIGAWTALAASQPASSEGAHILAGQLRNLGNELWLRGAMSSPNDYARRFKASPLSKESAQIRYIARLSIHSQQLALSQLWLQACAKPRAPCGDGILWDAFVERHAHLGLPIYANPFAPILDGQTPALWSLVHGGELIELGVERGFDPRPTEMLLAKPFMVSALLRGLCSARAVAGNFALGIDGASTIPASETSKPREGAPAGGMTKVSLSSLCIVAKASAAAKALVAAGCRRPGQPWLASGSLLRTTPDEKAELAAEFEQHAIGAVLKTCAVPEASVEAQQKRLRL